MTRKTIIVLLACVSALACGRRAADSTKPPEAEVTTGTPETQTASDANTLRIEEGMLRDLRITTAEVGACPCGDLITLLGELAVDQRAYAEVGAPAPARVTRLVVDAGDTVRRGQMLAELSNADLGRARAEYLSAAARVQLADVSLERKRGLASERIVPLREVQEAESAAAEARAAMRSARAAIAAFGVEPPANDGESATSSSFVLRAPVNGSVIERAAVVGQMLDPATPAFRIGNLSTLWLTVHAFERDAVRIEQGAVARLAFPALPGRDFQGVVTMVGRQVDRESRTVPVRIDVRNAGSVLRPGMSATAAIPISDATASGTAVHIPVAAVQRVRNDWVVFVPHDPRTFEIRRIGRGRDLAGDIEVLSGLRAGERIVVDGAFLLKAQAERAEADRDAH
jgi:cobalt-zinc-cadmium efflux system membrane fusion protein